MSRPVAEERAEETTPHESESETRAAAGAAEATTSAMTARSESWLKRTGCGICRKAC